MTFGCYNRAPLKSVARVQDGWLQNHISHTQEGLMITIEVPMTKDCQYSLLVDDPKCVGCKHKQQIERNKT